MNYEDLQKWFRDGGDDSLRVNYPLNENSVVFDLGGYHGSWTQKIYDRYQCHIHVFEPIPELYNNLVDYFRNKEKIKIYDFGISDQDKLIEIALLNDGSSFYVDSENKVIVKVVSFVKFLKEKNIENVDLIKINIEGDEFPVLKSLIDNGCINIFKNIQVQFHQFIPDSINLRNWIREKLKLTHKITYNYEFVWENWEKL
jgi:FkbM family methyltransferase